MTFLANLGVTSPLGSSTGTKPRSSVDALKYGNPNLDRFGMLIETKPPATGGKNKPGGKDKDKGKGKDKTKTPLVDPLKPAFAPTLADSSILFAGLRDMHNPNFGSFKLGGNTAGRPTLFGR